MIRGIGVDLCDIGRMRRALARGGFREKVFSKEEISYAEGSADPAKHYAGAFAAREALAKATGLGIGRMGLGSCRIERTETGPVFIFTDEFTEKLKNNDIGKVFLSISHETAIAVAMVVLESVE